MLSFNLLGPLEVMADEETIPITAPKVRNTLALLLMNHNRVVSTATVLEELWGNRPPRSSLTTTQTYMYQIRQSFSRWAGPEAAAALVTRQPGYMLKVDDEQIDAVRFERLARRGRTLLDAERPREAVAVLRAATSLWRGPGLADVSAGSVLEAQVTRLEELRISTTELQIEADLQLGNYRDVISELRGLIARYPLNEWLHGRLMLALSRADRRSEALQAYQNLRTILADELGLDPSPELTRIQRAVLTGGLGHRSEPTMRHAS